MTVLETFMSFTERLPADRLHAVEIALTMLMETYSDGHEFSAADLAELDRRAADPTPSFADPREIAKLLGKPFSA